MKNPLQRCPSAILLLVVITAGCLRPPQTTLFSGGKSPKGQLLFNSGFEADTTIQKRSENNDRIVGIDHSVSGNSNWSTIFHDTDGRLRGCTLHYNSGDYSCRQATIVPDPVHPNNQVIRFQGGASPSSPKFRIQADFSAPVENALKEFSYSVKLYVPEDMATLRDYPKAINWLTIAEFWNDSAWTSRADEHAFRVTVGIGKDAGVGNDLYFRISTDDFSHTGTGKNRKYKQIHLEIDRAKHFPIPFGKWMTLDYYYRDGDHPDSDGNGGGHFYMAATPEGGKHQEICSLRTIMHSPQNPSPKGVTLWAPIKMYTSGKLAAWMQAQGKQLELFYDDLKIWTGKTAEIPAPPLLQKVTTKQRE